MPPFYTESDGQWGDKNLLPEKGRNVKYADRNTRRDSFMGDVNCIFCDKSFVPGKDGEHIIPESIGGSLTIKEVCPACNSNLNQRFEQKFKDDFIVELGRYQNNIRGKRKNDKPPFPFRGFVDTDISAEGQLDDNFTPSLKTDIQFSKTAEDTFQIKGLVDASRIEEAIKSLERKLPQYIAELHPEYTGQQIREATDNRIKEFKEYCSKPENRKISRPMFHYKKKIDLNIYNLEYAKIAYEFAFHQFGKSFLTEKIALDLRNFLKGNPNNAEQYIKGIRLEEVILEYSHRKHYLFILDNKCIVSLFGFGMAITVTDSEIKRLTPMNSKIFIFDPVGKTHISRILSGYLNKKVAFSFITLLI